VVEHYTTAITSSAVGALNYQVNVSPAGLLLAARLAGYQALRDQIRIDRVVVCLIPTQSASTGTGQTAIYIDRDPTAATVANLALACDQFEKVHDVNWRPLVLTWRPQQPVDRTFNNLNPGTVSLATFNVVGNQMPASSQVYMQEVTVYATLRGRP
jgi:hypothetical protein